MGKTKTALVAAIAMRVIDEVAHSKLFYKPLYEAAGVADRILHKAPKLERVLDAILNRREEVKKGFGEVRDVMNALGDMFRR